MPDILFTITEDSANNKLGKIILNRPHALNAMSGDMFIQLQKQLTAWEKDDSIKAVLVRSSHAKAFCAGGDIRAVYDNQSQSPDILLDYFRREYAVNQQIFHYPKPYIALMNGITMGGGVGISVHGQYRIGSIDLRFAMPETLIGFFPDVGATYHLSRLPQHVGAYLALTGNVIHAQEVMSLKLLDAIVPFEQFDAVENAIVGSLNDTSALAKIIAHFHIEQNSKTVPMDCIEHCFGFNTLEEMIAALTAKNSEWSTAILSQLHMCSPISLKVALKQLQLAVTKSLDEVLAMDLCIARRMLEHHDFYEGIRAAIIDKDKNPQWLPARLSDVTQQQVDSYFI